MSNSLKITMRLSESSIDNAIRQVRDYGKNVKVACQKLIEALVEKGVEIAKMQVTSLNAVYTGELLNSIQGIYLPDQRKGYVFTDAAYAVYVEYGTGKVGADNPHPDPGSAGWQYDVNQHDTAGWWYLNDNDGRVHWTMGYQARPFMYNTLRMLEEVAPEVARGLSL